MDQQESFQERWRTTHYDRRSESADERRRKVSTILNNLEALWDKTDSKRWNETVAKKDLAAQEALFFAGQFIELMAGWAIDHAIGRAMHGQGIIRNQVEANEELPKQIDQPAEIDPHEYERQGRTLSWQFGPAVEHSQEYITTARRFLLILIEARSTGLPKDMSSLICQALDAVNHGDTPEMFEGIKIKWAKKNHLQLMSQLKAVEHVRFRVLALDGYTKEKAIDDVAEAYGVNSATIRNWIDEIEENLGINIVKSRLKHVTDAAVAFKNPNSTEVRVTSFEAGCEYNDTALKNDGKILHNLGLRKKTSRERRRTRPTRPH